MNLVQQFQQLWVESKTPPDVFAFLGQHPDVDVSEQLTVLMHDQQQRWKSDQPLYVETYLEKLPDLSTQWDSVFTLVINEYESRREHDSAPSVDEFTQRFPQLSERLRKTLSHSDGLLNDVGSTDLTKSDTRVSPRSAKQSMTRKSLRDFSEGNTVKGNIADSLTRTYVSDVTIGDHRRGRYRLVRILGEGGYGIVYLAVDEELRREVAVKVPNAAKFRGPADVESYLSEARMVAGLDHPNIVPVYDVGRTEDGSIYLVSKFIDGSTLTRLIGGDYPMEDLAEKIIAPIAIALDYAHRRRLVHRDVKPSNILIESHSGTPYLTDFGLAIRVEDYLSDGHIAGTPAYMSPEGARGEGHRLDGRSDIFSLASVFYELLTTKRPFRGSTTNELYYQVTSVEPLRPREIDESIPPELERICLKALSKRASDRYSTAAEFADDLLHWRGGVPERKRKQQVVPKGLRSFDSSDADFYLDLLPGPRDRHGLPGSIHFWKTQIEETDPDRTFDVGLVYGPSGCGKSSLIKAGLLPILSSDVLTLYLEATPDETETRILRGLRKLLPKLPRGLGLAETFAWLRRREGKKVLVVIDQFEQWLHSHRVENGGELVRALRQCDGSALQGLVMIRDDFAMAAARFMGSIEVPIVQGRNFATVDLFDVDHAEQVLVQFGQAFGKLPAQASRLTEEERQFVSSVAAGLAVDGKVVSVRLALFAEMIKSKRWVPSTLDDVGGTQGIGVNFLEETFGSRVANPSHRLHETAARKVLQALLPEVGTDIKGHMRSQAELAEACGYQERSSSFLDLMRILDGELRLITPTDPEGVRTDSGSNQSDKYFQLTHDYLVQALRTWLQRKQLETRRGRAELRLAQRSALWNAKPENRQLPSLWEWIPILAFTVRRNWSTSEQQMMAIAKRYYGTRLLLGCLMTGMLAAGSIGLTHRIRDARDRTRVDGLVEQLLVAKTADIPKITSLLEDEPESYWGRLREIAADPQRIVSDRLRANFVLARGDDEHSATLIREAMGSDPATLMLVRERLTPFTATQVDQLWTLAQDTEPSAAAGRLRASALLAVADPTSRGWSKVAPKIVQALMSESSLDRDGWVTLLQPVADALTPQWKELFLDSTALASDRIVAAGVLSQYADAELLCELLLKADPDQFPTLMRDGHRHEQAIVAAMRQVLRRDAPSDSGDPSYDRMSLNAALALLHFGQLDDVASILHASPDPTLRTRFMIQTRDYGVPSETLLSSCAGFSDPIARQAMLLALASYQGEEIPGPTMDRAIHELERLLRQSRFASERSAAELLFRRWGHGTRIDKINNELATPVTAATDRLREYDWWVNSQQYVMCVIDAPLQFTAGSPADEFLRNEDETLMEVRISYPFAVGAHEVSIKQYERFRAIPEIDFANSTGTNLPANRISLVQAMQYCRWLSEQEGVAEEQMCYPPVDTITLDHAFPTDDQLSKTGYRLLTEHEWEGVCRAGSKTTWFTGREPEMMDHFACAFPRSGNRPNSIGMMLPNAWGMFDMAGNILEWCHASGTHQDYAQKGGNFKQAGSNFRSARRYSQSGIRYSYNGFRIACTLPTTLID